MAVPVRTAAPRMLPPRPRPRRRPRNPAVRALRAAAWAVALALASDRAALAAQGVWKCAGTGGVPVYQDRPCEAAGALRDLAADPPPLSVVPFALPPSAAPAPARSPRRAEKPAAAQRRAPPLRVAGDAAQRRHVHEGMGEGEVLARLGTPDLVSGKGGRRMRWTYLPAPGDPQTLTTVRFEDGRVSGVERSVVR